jgi:hypothetical protein
MSSIEAGLANTGDADNIGTLLQTTVVHSRPVGGRGFRSGDRVRARCVDDVSTLTDRRCGRSPRARNSRSAVSIARDRITARELQAFSAVTRSESPS